MVAQIVGCTRNVFTYARLVLMIGIDNGFDGYYVFHDGDTYFDVEHLTDPRS